MMFNLGVHIVTVNCKIYTWLTGGKIQLSLLYERIGLYQFIVINNKLQDATRQIIKVDKFSLVSQTNRKLPFSMFQF